MPVNVFSTAATLLHRTMSSEFENVPDLPGIPPLELPLSSSSLSNNPNNFSFRLCRFRSECQKERAPLLSHCTPLMPLILFNSATVAAHSSGLRPPCRINPFSLPTPSMQSTDPSTDGLTMTDGVTTGLTMSSHAGPAGCRLHLHEPSGCTTPASEQVSALVYLHEGPMPPTAGSLVVQVHWPKASTTPALLQVLLFENSQVGPAVFGSVHLQVLLVW